MNFSVYSRKKYSNLQNFIDSESSQITIFKNNIKEIEIKNTNQPELIETMSVTKSICALAILFLLQDNKITDINDKISQYIKEWQFDSRKNITILEILSMTSQMENNWDYDLFMYPNGGVKKPNVNNIARHLNLSENYNKNIQAFDYNNLTSQIIPLIIYEITSKHIDSYLDEKLFKPLDIKYEWNKDDDKNPYGPNGFRTSSGELCKIGLLILNNGIFNNIKLLDEKLIKLLIKNNIKDTESIRKCNEMYHISKIAKPYGYGLSNWLLKNKNSQNIVMFMGYMGQYLIIDFDNRIVASKLNWCDYEADDFNNNEIAIYNEFIDDYII